MVTIVFQFGNGQILIDNALHSLWHYLRDINTVICCVEVHTLYERDLQLSGGILFRDKLVDANLRS